MAEMNGSTGTAGEAVVCYSPTMITTNGIWQGDNPLDFSLPVFLLQLMIIILMSRLVEVLLKPLRQPRVLAEILGGVILGPTVFGKINQFSNIVFPAKSMMVLQTMANIGLLYFLFLVGVEMDISEVRRKWKKAVGIALCGLVLPFMVGALLSLVLEKTVVGVSQAPFLILLGVSLSVTAFPVLARILAELKLLNTEIGSLAMSSALVNSMAAWILLIIAIALSDSGTPSLASLYVILSSAAFVLFYVFVVRRALNWMVQRTPEGGSFSELFIWLILTGVMISGFITDALGTHSAFGGFVFGLIIPNGPLGMTLIEKLEDFIVSLLLPLFFASSGLNADITIIKGAANWLGFLCVVCLACIGKIAGTVVAAKFICQMSYREGTTLGLLMNTKGLMEMIILSIGRDQNVLDEEAYAVMVVAAVLMTGIVTPLVAALHKPSRNSGPYTKRTIQKSRLEGEFRVLVCIHRPSNVSAIINLLEASYPNAKSPISVYVLHLVELTGRASAMLIVHNTNNTRSGATRTGTAAANTAQAQSDQIIIAFENLEQNHPEHVTIQPLTAISPYSTMHEDICGLGQDKHAAFIIIPFHKQQGVDGKMEATNPAFQSVNQNVLANAPCSVGILVDRGLSVARLTSNQTTHHIVMLFFGGPDDREALAYAWKMSEHPGISITLMQFVTPESGGDTGGATTSSQIGSTDLDKECVDKFRAENAEKESVLYTQRVVNNGEETLGAIRSIDVNYELVIVGRGTGTTSPLLAGLTDWSECPELGVVGDILASSDFVSSISVLVVQQYQGADQLDEIQIPDASTRRRREENSESADDDGQPHQRSPFQ